jgi:predicted DNA-binding protein
LISFAKKFVSRYAIRNVKGKRYDEVAPILVRIPLELHQRLRAVALQLGLTDAEAIRLAIAMFVEAKEIHAIIREIQTCNYRRRRRLGA